MALGASVGPTRTRGTIRMYWTEQTDCASRAFAREMAFVTIRDVLCEDRLAVEAGQRGISRGAIDKVYFQDHEILLRHLYMTVQDKVASFVDDQADVHPA